MKEREKRMNDLVTVKRIIDLVRGKYCILYRKCETCECFNGKDCALHKANTIVDNQIKWLWDKENKNER